MLIKNGLVVGRGMIQQSDIRVLDGKIQAIASSLHSYDGEQVHDAQGSYVTAGGVDIHTHMNLHSGGIPTADDFFTGTRAAAFGGTTSIVDHMEFDETTSDLNDHFEKYIGYAKDAACIDYGFHSVIQSVDSSLIEQLSKIKARGISSVKMYTTYGHKLSQGQMACVFAACRDVGILPMVHCEDDAVLSTAKAQLLASGHYDIQHYPQSRPAAAEAQSIRVIATEAQRAHLQSVYIVHVSSSQGVDAVEQAHEHYGTNAVLAETCPQYLVLDQQAYSTPDADCYVLCPPLRTKSDAAHLLHALKSGVISVVASDHCPFLTSEKLRPAGDLDAIAKGIEGVEERMPIMMSLANVDFPSHIQQVVRLCCENPARIAGLYPHKGVLNVGSDADIVIWKRRDSVAFDETHIHGGGDFAPYRHHLINWLPSLVFSRGQTLVEHGNFVGHRGYGKFLFRTTSAPPNVPYVNDRSKTEENQ